MKNLEDKVIWITGASSGIGEAIAKHLSTFNCKLILSARRAEELERVKKECQGNHEKIAVLTVDLSDTDSLEQKANDAEAIFGQVDVLINNGGISQRGTAEETVMEVDRRVMEVNYFGAIALTKYTLPGMIERKSGHQVIVTSVMGKFSTQLRSAYCASKHALHGFYNAMRSEVFRHNINVTIVAPGFIQTNIAYNALKSTGEQLKGTGGSQDTGISAEECAKQIVKAIRNDQDEIIIAGMKENFGWFMSRFFPSLYRKIIRKMKVT
ncbi:MAG: SDR family oxidoreductase [Bacteroidota bacterium]